MTSDATATANVKNQLVMARLNAALRFATTAHALDLANTPDQVPIQRMADTVVEAAIITETTNIAVSI